MANITPGLRSKFGIKQKSGVIVITVTPDSPADEAGIQASDVIKRVNHKATKTVHEYDNAMEKAEKGKPVLFLINRGGQTFYLSITVS